MSDAERFRQEAERCRKLAKTAANQIDKDALELMAVQWLRLAVAADYVSKMLQ